MFGCVSVHILAAGRQFEFKLMFGRVFGHSLDVGRQFDFFLMLGLVFNLWFTVSSRLTVIFMWSSVRPAFTYSIMFWTLLVGSTVITILASFARPCISRPCSFVRFIVFFCVLP